MWEKKEKVWSISAKSHIRKGYKWCKEKLKVCRREQLRNKRGEAAGAKQAVGSPAGRKGKQEQKWEPGDYVWSLSRGWGAWSEELRREGSQWRQIKSGGRCSLCREKKIVWAVALGIMCWWTAKCIISLKQRSWFFRRQPRKECCGLILILF